MYQICKRHRDYLQLITAATRLLSRGHQLTPQRHFGQIAFKSKPADHHLKSRTYCFSSCCLSTEAKEEKNNGLNEQSIDEPKSLLLFSPKWPQMYDIFHSGHQPVRQVIEDQISDKKNRKTSEVINKDSLDNDNKSINLLDTCDEWKPIEKLTTKSLLKYYTQLAKLRLTGISINGSLCMTEND